ncbi:MAG TPA: pseudouridine synthase [Alphaproteobacteria bacterium]|jgi:23S rRNA pseudouridine2605 synthase
MAEDSKDGEKGERIAKRMARAGVCSRREAEVMVLEGRVKVDNKVIITPATLVTDDMLITVDGKLIDKPERTRMWRYHKPRGLLTTNRDPQGRATIYDELPKHLPRVISVGRLDYNSEGLLLLTNDGGVARKLELPETGWARRYRVRAFGTLTPDQIEKMGHGMTVEGVRYGAIETQVDRQQGGNVWLTMTLSEGKNREIRKVLEAVGLSVSRLIRVAYGPFQLGRLEVGEVEEVPGRTLADQLGLDRKAVQLPREGQQRGAPAAAAPAATPASDAPKPRPYRVEQPNLAKRAGKAPAGKTHMGKPAYAAADRPAGAKPASKKKSQSGQPYAGSARPAKPAAAKPASARPAAKPFAAPKPAGGKPAARKPAAKKPNADRRR